ncbi:hypothetical protein SMACR_06631 [Sordaria macrospora]|uniref:WGS project CABT00000000 data, contig 2.37 n=2 Tax=Sordaria macrospora TaxID=5147 RepID=F7W751_SORMK|nr:uncharacterized protein SMAC_06631 [Sordaria macrospora k-hell]KAA8630437.1 hypothetical protein SMACR_06631 [Sordaria macrospora]KAH7633524.1 hypothetical protein B0T09DRAFT_380975 [Sordaria sp. MPI-SDFR-AT-0083]WPJ60080.1 hypothetical protein SMAC4_06631 [Sordaria macrospora]CCC13342.1 unnamed protein product [Sordaria macrospora k-hell]
MIPRTAAGSALRTLTRATTQTTKPSSRTYLQVQSLRQYSSSSNPPSPTGVFYKTFTRPVAKCLLTALFVYQVIYWGWSKLEVDEIKEERQAEITKLEAQVRALKLQRENEKEKEAEAAAAVALNTGTSPYSQKKKGWGWW